MSHKVKGQGRNRCQSKERSRCRLLTTNDEGSVSSVSCKKPKATGALLLLSWSKHPNILTVNLFDDQRGLLRFPRLSSLPNSLEPATDKYINGVSRNYPRRVNTSDRRERERERSLDIFDRRGVCNIALTQCETQNVPISIRIDALPPARGHRTRDEQWIHAERTLNKHIKALSARTREPPLAIASRLTLRPPSELQFPVAPRGVCGSFIAATRNTVKNRAALPSRPPPPAPSSAATPLARSLARSRSFARASFRNLFVIAGTISRACARARENAA